MMREKRYKLDTLEECSVALFLDCPRVVKDNGNIYCNMKLNLQKKILHSKKSGIFPTKGAEERQKKYLFRI